MNVYENENDRSKYLERYFTKEGVNALETRLKALAKLYLEDRKYPFTAKMYGFPALQVKSKEHLEGMMENLKEILGLMCIEVDE